MLTGQLEEKAIDDLGHETLELPAGHGLPDTAKHEPPGRVPWWEVLGVLNILGGGPEILELLVDHHAEHRGVLGGDPAKGQGSPDQIGRAHV